MGKARPLARLERSERIEAETARIIELYREFDDAEQVAAALGIKVSRVRRLLREAGKSIQLLRIERAAELYQATGSIEACAAQAGVTLAAMRSRLESAALLKLIDEPPALLVKPRRLEVQGQQSGWQSGKRLDPQLEAATIALYEELQSLRKVGAKLGISQEAVRLRLMNAGYALNRNPRLTDADERRAVALYEEMQSIIGVAAEMERSPLTIRNALVRRGVHIRRAGWHRQLRDARLHRRIGEARMMRVLYERLGTEIAVAEILDCSQALVSNRLRLVGAAPGRGNHRRGPRGTRNVELSKLVVALYDEGASARQAALQCGVQPHTAINWLRAAGYDTSKAALSARRRAA
jgi:hypothetical protein